MIGLIALTLVAAGIAETAHAVWGAPAVARDALTAQSGFTWASAPSRGDWHVNEIGSFLEQRGAGSGHVTTVVLSDHPSLNQYNLDWATNAACGLRRMPCHLAVPRVTATDAVAVLRAASFVVLRNGPALVPADLNGYTDARVELARMAMAGQEHILADWHMPDGTTVTIYGRGQG